MRVVGEGNISAVAAANSFSLHGLLVLFGAFVVFCLLSRQQRRGKQKRK